MAKLGIKNSLDFAKLGHTLFTKMEWVSHIFFDAKTMGEFP